MGNGVMDLLFLLDPTALQGVKAIIAETYERIHRSNLVGMGIVPLQYLEGETAETLGLTGREEFTINLPSSGLQPGQLVEVQVHTADQIRPNLGEGTPKHSTCCLSCGKEFNC